MDWKTTISIWEDIFNENGNTPNLTKALTECKGLTDILNLRKSVMFIVKSNEDFRTIFVDIAGAVGITTVKKDNIFLTWKFEYDYVGIYSHNEICILTPTEANKYLGYLMDEQVSNQSKALLKITKNAHVYTKDFL